MHRNVNAILFSDIRPSFFVRDLSRSLQALALLFDDSFPI
uniref:Uncharacterized protein n=1 Tax=Anguilla anguilla TaxID=7936 RepID=A0A0E9PAI0_ANGAN